MIYRYTEFYHLRDGDITHLIFRLTHVLLSISCLNMTIVQFRVNVQSFSSEIMTLWLKEPWKKWAFWIMSKLVQQIPFISSCQMCITSQCFASYNHWRHIFVSSGNLFITDIFVYNRVSCESTVPLCPPAVHTKQPINQLVYCHTWFTYLKISATFKIY